MNRIKIDKKTIEQYYGKIKDDVRERVREELSEMYVFDDASEQASYRCFLEQLLLNEGEKDDINHPLWKIICSTPDKLIEFVSQYSFIFAELNKEEKGNKLRNHLTRIFNYSKDIVKTDVAYWLTEKLGVKVCPYCNRSFIHTVKTENDSGSPGVDRKKIIRPELDHYFSQKEYPMLALSIYNLVPSCHICNSNIKGTRNLYLEEHFHPYIDENMGIKFSFTFDQETNNTVINIKGMTEKATNTKEFFRLDEIYKYHAEESEHIYALYRDYSNEYIDNLIHILRDADVPITKNRILRMVYDHFQIKNPDDEILGHLRSDLLEQILKQYQ